jgi:uncharacterized membrane protein YwaF
VWIIQKLLPNNKRLELISFVLTHVSRLIRNPRLHMIFIRRENIKASSLCEPSAVAVNISIGVSPYFIRRHAKYSSYKQCQRKFRVKLPDTKLIGYVK